jgi:hypothetical protein
MRPAERPMRPERIGSRTAKIGTLQHFRWLKNIVFATLILNVVDAVFTVIWISAGLATEANPMMTVVHDDPYLFVTVKLMLVGLGSYLLWQQRKRPGAVVGIFIVFLAYYFVVLYHLQAMNLRVFERFF